MTVGRAWRFYYRLIYELSAKYTSALIFGCVIGIIGSLSILRIIPVIQKTWFSPVERIGIVGDYTPTTLPVSIQQLISTGLTTVEDDGNVSPGLASRWEATQSGATYVFHLKSDLVWQNGKKVEAKDVNYNIKDVTFSVKDPHTLTASLKEPYSPFPSLVAKPIFGPGLLGFGAYKVASIHLKGENVTYLRLLPSINFTVPSKEFRFYRTEAQAIIAYKLGDIDTIEDITNTNGIRSWGNTTIIPNVHYNQLVVLFYNLKNDMLGERSFRQGLSYAIPNTDEEYAYSPISKKSWAYSDAVRHYDYDLTSAKKLFKSSQVSSESASLVISTFAPYLPFAQEIAKSWSGLGIPTGVNVINDLSNNYQVLLTAQNIPPDPDQYPFWHSTQESTNITHYVNVKIDKLLEDGRKELNQNARKKIYADFARRLVDDAPAAFLYYSKTYTVKRNK